MLEISNQIAAQTKKNDIQFEISVAKERKSEMEIGASKCDWNAYCQVLDVG